MGFSAGGHLAGSAGLMWNKQEIYRPLRRRPSVFRPDGVVLCYPVVTGGASAHRGSMENLLGERHDELLELVSLENRVTRQAPPFFLWHTADDTCVPVENSLLLDKALRAKGMESELHVYPHGSHGQSLADHTVFAPGQDWVISAPCAVWVPRHRLAPPPFRRLRPGSPSGRTPAARKKEEKMRTGPGQLSRACPLLITSSWSAPRPAWGGCPFWDGPWGPPDSRNPWPPRRCPA